MSKITKEDVKFKEYMGGFFYDLLRASGITMLPGNSHERLRAVGERMASAIETSSERKSIQVIKKLQFSVVQAFEKIEDELDEIKEIQKENQELIEELEEKIKELDEKKVNWFED